MRTGLDPDAWFLPLSPEERRASFETALARRRHPGPLTNGDLLAAACALRPDAEFPLRRREPDEPGEPLYTHCLGCGSELPVPRRRHRRFCSRACAKRHERAQR